jgi:hypothetical protein
MKPPSANAVLTAKNVQRGLASKIQETSGLFRKKQKVYMDRKYLPLDISPHIPLITGSVHSVPHTFITFQQAPLPHPHSRRISESQYASTHLYRDIDYAFSIDRITRTCDQESGLTHRKWRYFLAWIGRLVCCGGGHGCGMSPPLIFFQPRTP